jgi:hypothetical protein
MAAEVTITVVDITWQLLKIKCEKINIFNGTTLCTVRGFLIIALLKKRSGILYSRRIHIFLKCFICVSAYFIGFDIHLLEVKVHCCKADRITDITLHAESNFPYRIWGSHSGGYEEFCLLDIMHAIHWESIDVGGHHLHLQSRRISQARKHHKVDSKQSCSVFLRNVSWTSTDYTASYNR